MTRVLVDTSVWIAFFKGDETARVLFPLLDSGEVCTNELILSELIPPLRHRREDQIIDMLEEVQTAALTIVWPQITEMQGKNLRAGINRVGIPDLIIAQNALQNDLPILSFDKHFHLMKAPLGLTIYDVKAPS